MKFADPQRIECPHCGAFQRHPVDELLSLRAICQSCDRDLKSVGAEMNFFADTVGSQITVMYICIVMEEWNPDLKIGDDELDSVVCLNDLVDAVANAIPSVGDDVRHAVASRMVSSAVEAVFPTMRHPRPDILLAEAFRDVPPVLPWLDRARAPSCDV